MSCHFPIGILDQVWCLIVSIPELFSLSYFDLEQNFVYMISDWSGLSAQTHRSTVLQAKSDSDFMFCLVQSYQGLIDRSLVY